MPVATPPVRVTANHVQKPYFGLASRPPSLTLPSLENVTTVVRMTQAMMAI